MCGRLDLAAVLSDRGQWPMQQRRVLHLHVKQLCFLGELLSVLRPRDGRSEFQLLLQLCLVLLPSGFPDKNPLHMLGAVGRRLVGEVSKAVVWRQLSWQHIVEEWMLDEEVFVNKWCVHGSCAECSAGAQGESMSQSSTSREDNLICRELATPDLCASACQELAQSCNSTSSGRPPTEAPSRRQCGGVYLDNVLRMVGLADVLASA
eukprot:CAMPEP_0177241514 /NCGR_PEP_ID=MMETSP0367-20130122/48313_1 /TAXON_ID=447022 ORGANISM="Scrippsiella hangoei-like, Strain SHHI-4" /NCGR_SAMPLE_ID=MMETSP0367 /ASSEMBLY_ACC=CAM_ASM_000362 /LENGTH=205 /DNA_ID=CAMNT_0018693065 /DNA_START=301 /DNA_END=915 /DNA_ORIENTATION=-